MAANDLTSNDRIEWLRGLANDQSRNTTGDPHERQVTMFDDGEVRFLIEVIDELKRTRVQIVEALDKPTECRVWRDGVLKFDGVDRSILLRR